MMLLSKSNLDFIKKEVLLDLKAVVDKINIDQLSKFNKGYLAYRNDPYEKFLLNELGAWNNLIEFYALRRGNDCQGIIDIGTFIPYYPAVLKKIGYQIEVIEKVSLYGEAYKPIQEYLAKEGIRLHNMDIMSASLDTLPKGFDILLVAVLEHLNGSPRGLIEKVKMIMERNSLLYIHVPNICKLNNIITMIMARSPLPAYKNYFFSDYPFTGHNREMTLEELEMLCEFTLLKIVERGYIVKAKKNLSWKGCSLSYIKKIMTQYADSVYVVAKKV